LTKAIIGAGMMPIPHAFNLLGWVAACGMLIGVAAVTYWTNAVMVQGSADTGEGSYASLVGRLVGPAGAGLLQAALFGFCFGVMAVYLVVIGDIMAGAPGAGNGLVSELFGVKSGPLLQRSNIILGVAAAVCAPLVAVRDISKLSVFNILGVGAVMLLAATAGLLGLTALITGAAHIPPAAPNLAAFGDSSLRVAMGMAGVVPIILNCYVGHQSVHGIMAMLKPYSVNEMKAVCAGSLIMGLVIFLVLGLGSVAAFGGAVDANILNNLSAGGMAGLLGPQLASVLSVVVRGGFLVSLLGSFALLMFPLRTCLIELIWNKQLAAAGSGPAKAAVTGEIEQKHYTVLTYGILASTVATAVLVPDIWAALSIVGDLASTVQAFVVPALIGLALAAGKHLQGAKGAALDSSSSSSAWFQKLMSLLVLAVGVALFGNGILQRVLA
jgi:amino acid permease